mmetsp:Transcript_5795/g.9253  ORF Transcript_5795/g.9253 Transcript_5795/m.9253 type:complete len:97 (-) Transcript_5795:2066-2356(-)
MIVEQKQRKETHPPKSPATNPPSRPAGSSKRQEVRKEENSRFLKDAPIDKRMLESETAKVLNPTSKPRPKTQEGHSQRSNLNDGKIGLKTQSKKHN